MWVAYKRFLDDAQPAAPAEVVLATSTDAAVTWSRHVVALAPGETSTTSRQVDIDGAGSTIALAWHARPGATLEGASLYASVSHDLGRTWSAPTLISADAAHPSIDVVDPLDIRIAFARNGPSARDDLAIARTEDGGLSWAVELVAPGMGSTFPSAAGTRADLTAASGTTVYRREPFRGWEREAAAPPGASAELAAPLPRSTLLVSGEWNSSGQRLLFTSTSDAGATWCQRELLKTFLTWDVAIEARPGAPIWVAAGWTPDQNVSISAIALRSEDGGQTWRSYVPLVPYSNALDLDVSAPLPDLAYVVYWSYENRQAVRVARLDV